MRCLSNDQNIFNLFYLYIKREGNTKKYLLFYINYFKYIKCQEKEDCQINLIMIEIRLNNWNLT